MDSDNVISSSAYLLFYRRRSNKPLGGDLAERIQAYSVQTHVRSHSSQSPVSDGGPLTREISLPPYDSIASNSSPALSTSSEVNHKPDAHVPFASNGRPLGGMQHDDYPSVQAPSNPFATGSSWGSARPKTDFATTSSEGSGTTVPRFTEQENESATDWSNSD